MCYPVYDDQGNIIGVACPGAVGSTGKIGATGKTSRWWKIKRDVQWWIYRMTR